MNNSTIKQIYYTGKIPQTKKTRKKSTFATLFLKAAIVEKFAIDSSAFRILIILSTKNLPEAMYLLHVVLVVGLSSKKSQTLTFNKLKTIL